jgi:hypothetical protein
MSSITALSLRILVWYPTLIGLDLPLTTLVGITGKRKKLLTYTQETARAKLERLCSVRFIHGDKKTTTRHAMALSKAKVVADTLSRKAHYNYLSVVSLTGEESSARVLPDRSLLNIIITPTWRDEIIAAQKTDEGMSHIKRRMQKGDPKVACFHKDVEGTLWFKERLVVLKKEALKKKILDEDHTLRYSIHPGSTKMYRPKAAVLVDKNEA